MYVFICEACHINATRHLSSVITCKPVLYFTHYTFEKMIVEQR